MEPLLTVPLRRLDGEVVGAVRLWPSRPRATLAPGILREAAEYRYVVTCSPPAVGIEPRELFDPDVDAIERDERAELGGRFRTWNYVGTLEASVALADRTLAYGLLEIHSAKLDYESQYRWMLSGVAAEGAALLLRSFAPTVTTQLTADLTRDAATIYQQVAFLAAILRRPHTVEAFERILRSPHVSYVDTIVDRPVGLGIPGSSGAIRAMIQAGTRVPVEQGLVVESIPARLRGARSEATIDNPPNQLVRFVLEHWAAVLDSAGAGLTGTTPDERRGRREIGELLDVVDGLRSDRRLRDVGALAQWPAGNQVILRRPGYREIHQAFLESRAAAMLRWEAVDDLHRAGQRDIAQLYEYWCYLELRRLVEQLCDYSDSSPLVELTDDRMHLVLRRGTQRVVNGFLTRHGRQIDVELWFNRTFRKEDESWSLQMRPDCSLRFSAQGAPGEQVETWVHFDAKYRVDSVDELFIGDDEPRSARRSDLLKMHAYRDAIRGSAGAYILFPGGDRKVLRQHYEVLPGLGAFPFVPGSDGHATPESESGVLAFIDDLIEHIAEQASNRERAEFWVRAAHRSEPPPTAHAYVPLRRPPADTSVLLGYYRSPEHLAWIEGTRRYNMRFGDRSGAVEVTGAEASAELLLLWSQGVTPVRMWWLDSVLELLDERDMSERAYPGKPDGRYLCRVLRVPFEGAPTVGSDRIRRLVRGVRFGSPKAATWADIRRAVDTS